MKQWTRPRHRGGPSDHDRAGWLHKALCTRCSKPGKHSHMGQQLRALVEQSERAAEAATELDHVVLMTPLPGRTRPYSAERSA